MDTKSKAVLDALVQQIGQLSAELAIVKGDKAELAERLEAMTKAHLDRRPHLVKEANGPSD